MVESTNRTIKKENRESESFQNNPQRDTDARSGKKKNRYYFGYKGHIGVEEEGNLINKAIFSLPIDHNALNTKDLAILQPGTLFEVKAYADDRIKLTARDFG